MQKKRRFNGQLPGAVLPLFRNHGFTVWSETLRVNIKKWEFPNSILVQLLVHLTQVKKLNKKEQRRLVGEVEKHIVYVDNNGRLTIRRKTFRLLVEKGFLKAKEVAAEFPRYATALPYERKAA